MPKLFKYHSASVACSLIDRQGVMTITYSGAMNREAFSALRERVVAASIQAKAMVIHLHGALLLMAESPEITMAVDAWRRPDSAIIVNPVQVALLNAHSRTMARAGVTQLVFLRSQSELAQQWAIRRAMPAAVKSQSLPNFAQ